MRLTQQISNCCMAGSSGDVRHISYRICIRYSCIFVQAAFLQQNSDMLSVKKTEAGERRHFVICDFEKEYAERLFRILTEKCAGTYECHLFHDAKKAAEFSEKKEIDLLLIAEEYPVEEREKIRTVRTFFLTGEREKADADEEDFIFRYQNVEKTEHILFGKTKKIPVQTISRNTFYTETDVRNTVLIGVYSPVHRIGKTKFSIKLGKRLAKKYPVLYLNLEGYSGGHFYFPAEEVLNLGDLLYFTRQEKGNTGFKINMAAGHMNGMDYILPMENENDLRSVTPMQWMELFDTIEEQCIYEKVVVDLSDAVNGLYEILLRCCKIYTPYIEDAVSMAKMEQYERSLKQSGYEDIIRKTVKRCMKRHSCKEESVAESV